MRRLWVLLLCVAGCQCSQPQPGEDAGVEGPLDFRHLLFDSVLRGEWLERTGTFVNASSRPVEVSGLAIVGPAFTFEGPTSLVVPANGEATVPLRFTPTQLGPHAATLNFDAKGVHSSVNLRGLGVGPALTLEPERLELGTFALYDGVPTTASAMLTVRNLGLDAVPTRPETALQLFFEVQSTSAAALPEELCVGDCLGTAIRVAVDAFTLVPVVLRSTTPGLKTWDLRVLSNDPTAPMRTVQVSAELIARPTCQYALTPALAFGVLTSPESRDLEAVFENVGTEVCEVSSVALGPDVPAQRAPLYSVVNAPSGTRQVAPGELLRVTVRAWPQGPVPRVIIPVRGELILEVNHPAGPARVPLTAELQLTCLSVAPSPVDFGTVQTGCRSADRQITLRNTCTRSIGVTAATLPGFSTFSVSGALPRTLPPTGAVVLNARYTPFAAGPSNEVIDVSWTDGALQKHTTVPLRGEANATGINTDRFPPRSSKLDLLLVIDQSASMTTKVQHLNAQLPALLSALQAHNVDFQLGVIPAVRAGFTPPGVLRQTNDGLRWLTPATPNLQLHFSELTAFMQLGDDESCEVPVWAALTAPKVNDPLINGGFLRPDALLSVLCITDKNEVPFLLSEVLQLKEPGALRWDVIGPVDSTDACGNEWFPTPGHIIYTEATGGVLQDICADDWSSMLNGVATQTSVRTFFPLRAQPDLQGTSPLAVTVAGQNVIGTTDAGVEVWSLESTPNAVVFSPMFAPAPADLVSIDYSVACMP